MTKEIENKPMQPSNSSSSEEEVLLAYSVEPTHDRATLERYLTKYPDHASSLVDCALELMTLPAQISPVWLSEGAVEAGWQKFQSAVGAASESPFAKLSPSTFKKLAVTIAALANEGLQFGDAVRIARGCLDYGGGYRSDNDKMEIFHHGIQTVINALEAADKRGLQDTQVAALHAMGRPNVVHEPQAPQKIQ